MIKIYANTRSTFNKDGVTVRICVYVQLNSHIHYVRLFETFGCRENCSFKLKLSKVVSFGIKAKHAGT